MDMGFEGDLTVKCICYDAPPVGESVESIRGLWLDAAEREVEKAHGLIRRINEGFTKAITTETVEATVTNPKSERASVAITFNQRFPKSEAAFLKITITGRTLAGSFRMPGDCTDSQMLLFIKPQPAIAHDSWFFNINTPCLARELHVTARKGAATFANLEYSVNFDRRIHKAESRLFEKWQISDGCGVANDGSEFTILLESPLPGAEYRLDWHIKEPTRWIS